MRENTKTAKVVEVLESSEDYVTAADLAEAAGVKKNYIPAVIKNLRNKGFEIENRNRKGYKLVSQPVKDEPRAEATEESE